MKVRLIEEKDSDRTFYKVQYWTLLNGWQLVHRTDSITCDKTKAEDLYNDVINSKNVRMATKVLHQTAL